MVQNTLPLAPFSSAKDMVMQHASRQGAQVQLIYRTVSTLHIGAIAIKACISCWCWVARKVEVTRAPGSSTSLVACQANKTAISIMHVNLQACLNGCKYLLHAECVAQIKAPSEIQEPIALQSCITNGTSAQQSGMRQMPADHWKHFSFGKALATQQM